MKIMIPLAALMATSAPMKAAPKSDLHNTNTITRIAFGSCNNPGKPAHDRTKVKSVFEVIHEAKPDVFIFLGDNIYGDTQNMEVLKKKYQALEDVDDFRTLRDNTIMLATWDDHDYGVNDGDKTYPKRKESAKVFLDFFKEPKDSSRRNREGIYASYTFGEGESVCQILLLDTRYFRDPLPKNKNPKGPAGWYSPTLDTSKTLLGAAQWAWLEEQLQVPANVRIIASSIQTLAFEKGMENWGNVPHEQNRLFELLKEHRAEHTFAISGDVHFAELSKRDIGGYPFYDLTSSGMTHTHGPWARLPNSFRVGESHFERNAGIIDIDWKKQALTLRIINDKGETILDHPVPFDELTFRAPSDQ